MFCLCTFMVNAQEMASTTTSEKTKKTCVPTKECAAKMGMTLAECKKTCTKTAAGETKVASAVLSNEDTPALTKECAKKCTKLADAKSDSETQVASAILVNNEASEIESNTAKKACAKSCKKNKTKQSE